MRRCVHYCTLIGVLRIQYYRVGLDFLLRLDWFLLLLNPFDLLRLAILIGCLIYFGHLDEHISEFVIVMFVEELTVDFNLVLLLFRVVDKISCVELTTANLLLEVANFSNKYYAACLLGNFTSQARILIIHRRSHNLLPYFEIELIKFFHLYLIFIVEAFHVKLV